MEKIKKNLIDVTIINTSFEGDCDYLEGQLQDFFENHKFYAKLDSVVEFMKFREIEGSLQDFLNELCEYEFFHDSFLKEEIEFEQEFQRFVNADHDFYIEINFHHNIK